MFLQVVIPWLVQDHCTKSIRTELLLKRLCLVDILLRSTNDQQSFVTCSLIEVSAAVIEREVCYFATFCLRLFFFFRRGPNLEIARCYLPFCIYFRGYSLVQARGTFHQIWEKRSYPGTFRCVLDVAVYNSGALHLTVYVILLNQMLCCFIPMCNFYSSFNLS